MKKRIDRRDPPDALRREYDLSKLKGGVRGKYVGRCERGTSLVLLSPDVAEYFPDEQSVNAALRTLIHVAKVRSDGRAKCLSKPTICALSESRR